MSTQFIRDDLKYFEHLKTLTDKEKSMILKKVVCRLGIAPNEVFNIWNLTSDDRISDDDFQMLANEVESKYIFGLKGNS